MTMPQLLPVSPRLASVYRVRAAITALVLLALALGAEAGLRSANWPVPGLVLALWTAYAIWSVGLRPQRLQRAWGWHLDDLDLHVAGGLLWRTHTIVPLMRVQHFDVAQGPLERAHGLATLVVHTAGVASTAVALPGLPHDEAVALRDRVRAGIVEDAA